MSLIPVRGMLLLLVISLHSPNLWAAEKAFIRILAPADGAKFSAQGPNTLTYEAATGTSRGNHVHVYVDDKEVVSLHHMKGNYAFKKLTLGAHKICVKVANKAHVATGMGQCIQVTVE